MDRGARRASVHGVTKELDMTEWLHNNNRHTHTYIYIYIYMSLCIITESICCIPKTWINYTWIKYNFKKKKREIPGITGKFGLWAQNETGQRPTVLPRECTGQSTLVCQQHKRGLYTWTSPDVNTEIRLFIFFAAKDGEALYSQHKQDLELTVAQVMNSLLQFHMLAK